MTAAPPRCPSCLDDGHVCEEHPGRPWGGMCCEEPPRAKWLSRLHALLPYRGPFRLAWRIRVLCEHGACHCGGAGMPCPACCSPIPQDGAHPIAEAFTPDWKRDPASPPPPAIQRGE
jgi:hypothetical protein